MKTPSQILLERYGLKDPEGITPSDVAPENSRRDLTFVALCLRGLFSAIWRLKSLRRKGA